MNVAQKNIASHLLEGEMRHGEEIALKIDQTLTQDAIGTMVMLELEAMHVNRVKTELSAQYVDHNLLQEDHKNPDDQLFLQSACRRFGLWFSRAGNGVSHPLHQERFGIPGKTLLGSDSHTCAAGAIGMLAIGAGGLDVAMAMAGAPFYVTMPAIWGIELSGSLRDWTSAKDVILELLRRHGVKGGMGRIIEYHGPGLKSLSAMDRHVIANMGAELGATTVFNSTFTKNEVEEFVANLTSQDPVLRQAARESLVTNSSNEGTQALVVKLSDSRQHVRWEAAKALATLADPETAPALAHALEDDSEGVRWLAAEGLIALGKAGLTAVLFALMTRATSVTCCRGAHHVLRAWDDNRTVDIIKPVLIALSGSEPGVSVPPAAYKALLELEIGLGPKP